MPLVGLCIAQRPWDPSVHAVREGNGHPMGTWESQGDHGGCLGALGVFSGCGGDRAQVWLGAVWMEALDPPGWIREDGLDQLSIDFGFLS